MQIVSLKQPQLFSVPNPPDAATSPELPRILNRPRKTLQEVHFRESLLAVSQIGAVTQIEELRARLAAQLPQNSETTRLRYADSLIRWFFRDGLQGLALSIWRRYQDQAIQVAIHRYLYLSAEPIVARCVVELLPKLQERVVVPADYLISHTEKLVGHELAELTRKRLLSNLRKLGFLERSASGDRVAAPPVSKTALLLSLHHAFNVAEPRTIEFAQIEANPFWCFGGLRTVDSLRDFLREADHAGAIGKYVVADRLEQITTCYSLAQLLEKRLRL